jgi:hypothetical protein
MAASVWKSGKVSIFWAHVRVAVWFYTKSVANHGAIRRLLADRLNLLTVQEFHPRIRPDRRFGRLEEILPECGSRL